MAPLILFGIGGVSICRVTGQAIPIDHDRISDHAQ